MKATCLLVIVLALACVSNQNVLSFGEFLDIHYRIGDFGSFQIIGSSDKDVRKTLKNRKPIPFVTANAIGGIVKVGNLCKACVNNNDGKPDCSKERCDQRESVLFNFIKDVVYIKRKTTVEELLKNEVQTTFKLYGCSDCDKYLELKRVR